MKKLTLVSALATLLCALGLFLNACHREKSYSGMLNDNFNKFKENFVEDLWKVYPVWATSVGYHKYDSLLPVPNTAYRKSELMFAQISEQRLKTFCIDSLDANNRTDYRMISNFLDGLKFNVNEYRAYMWDPSWYNIGDALFYVMNNSKASLDDRLRSVSLRLAKVPAYFKAARKNIENPTLEHTRLAIQQGEGTMSFFTDVFPDSLKKSGLSQAEKDEFTKNADAAEDALGRYILWLKDDMIGKHDSTWFRSFRIGKALYSKKFLIDIDSRYTADQIYQKALDRKRYLHEDMNNLTDKLWTKYLPTVKAPDDSLAKIKMLIDTISVHHCSADSFLQTIEKQLPELVKFINAHNLITLDSTKPLKVRKTPDYMAGVAGAGINSPGPYDKNAVTWYNVTPLTGYSPQKAESYLREYNDYVLQILNIHEAIPGHYTQLIYANRSPSIIKSLFGNNAMIEGWACYAERMMIEQGYNASPEMQLFYDKWNLREVCNFILDYNIHCNNWSKDSVMDLLVNQAFQQKAESEEKWKRACLTQVQLACYYTGVNEIYELRQELKAKCVKEGKNFDLKKFHEDFLSYGSAPVKEIRALMINKG